jgi:hypothetical protein
MTRSRALVVCVLVVFTTVGCVHRRWGKCARYGSVIGGVVGSRAASV